MVPYLNGLVLEKCTLTGPFNKWHQSYDGSMYKRPRKFKQPIRVAFYINVFRHEQCNFSNSARALKTFKCRHFHITTLKYVEFHVGIRIL